MHDTCQVVLFILLKSSITVHVVADAYYCVTAHVNVMVMVVLGTGTALVLTSIALQLHTCTSSDSQCVTTFFEPYHMLSNCLSYVSVSTFFILLCIAYDGITANTILL
jgi:hypothetical protein